MRRSVMMLRLMQQLKQQDQLFSKIPKWVAMNVITLVSPSPMMSQQMAQELEKWTQPLLPQNIVDDTTTSRLDSSDKIISKTAELNHLGSHYFHYPSDRDDALNAWVRTKQAKHNSLIFHNLLQQQQKRHSHEFDVADSVVLCVNGGGGDLNSTMMTTTTESLDHTTIPITLLHFVSSNAHRNTLFSFIHDENKNNAMSLLAIQSMYVSLDVACDPKRTVVQEIRNRLVQLLIDKEHEHQVYTEQQRNSLSWMENINILVRQYVRRLQQQHYHGKNSKMNSSFTSLQQTNEFVPFFDFTASLPPFVKKSDEFGKATIPKWNIGDLKEIVIPFDFANKTYGSNPTTLIEMLSSARHHELHRPVTGLYQLPNSNVCIRPIPMAKEDRQYCTSPTLIFHSDTKHMDGVVQQNHTIETNDTTGTAKIMKIGYTGCKSHGQLMITDSMRLGGIGVRLCSQEQPTSVFAEAQDSLLASSLSELQSQHVLLSKSDSITTKDSRTNNTDCWVEFRANLRHPLGFLPSSSLLSGIQSNPPKIAKAPDLPYE